MCLHKNLDTAFYYSDFINIISYLYAIYYLLYSGDSNLSLYYKIFNKYLQNHIICEILILKNKRTLRRMFFHFLTRVLKDGRRTHHLRYSIKECVESLFYFNKTLLFLCYNKYVGLSKTFHLFHTFLKFFKFSSWQVSVYSL